MSHIQHNKTTPSDLSLNSGMNKIASHADSTIAENLNRTKTFWERLCPSAIDRAVIAGEQKLVDARYRALFESMDLVQKAQIRHVAEQLDNLLTRHKVELACETSEIIKDEIAQTTTALKQSTENEARQGYSRQRGEEFLKNDLDQFIEWVEREIAGVYAKAQETHNLFSGRF
jgi:hypothetical protein